MLENKTLMLSVIPKQVHENAIRLYVPELNDGKGVSIHLHIKDKSYEAVLNEAGEPEFLPIPMSVDT